MDGWVGKPMGLYQECWLLAHIARDNEGNYHSPSCLSMYSKEGKKSDGEEKKEFCLLFVRSSCSDFVNKKVR
jgi:hypothetical protein